MSKSYCLSLFGSVLWSLPCPALYCIEAAFNKILRKNWHLLFRSHTGIVHSVTKLKVSTNLIFRRSTALTSSVLFFADPLPLHLQSYFSPIHCPYIFSLIFCRSTALTSLVLFFADPLPLHLQSYFLPIHCPYIFSLIFCRSTALTSSVLFFADPLLLHLQPARCPSKLVQSIFHYNSASLRYSFCGYNMMFGSHHLSMIL